MPKTMKLELPSGKTLFFGSQTGTGLQDVSLADKLPEAAKGQFEAALGALSELIGVLEKQVDDLKKRPSKVEIEFGASLSGDCNLWIVSGEGKAEFKVKLAWEGQKEPPAA
jgi:hypothetical protein